MLHKWRQCEGPAAVQCQRHRRGEDVCRGGYCAVTAGSNGTTMERLPAHAVSAACQQCRLRKTETFTAVKPEVLDFIQGFRSERPWRWMQAVRWCAEQTNAKLFTLIFRLGVSLQDAERRRRQSSTSCCPAIRLGCSRSL